MTRKTYQCAKVLPVPPEEFGISRFARTVKDAGYCFHELLKSESELIEQGYDKTQVKRLPSYTLPANTTEAVSRDTVNESSTGAGDEGMNRANRQIQVTEHYVRMNYDGTGAKLWRVCTAGEPMEVLRHKGGDTIVEEDTPPFAAMTPVIMTHRFFGRSVADLVLDIQRIKTALLRGMLDNMYFILNPRTEVSESHMSDNTLDDLLVSRPLGIVRTKAPGGLLPLPVQDVTPSVFPALQYMDATREWRTGVSRQGQGVDPNALQNQVATIANQMYDAAQQKCRLIARIFAETGVKDLFQLLHGTVRKNGSQAQTVRLRNQWVQVDPRDWKERNDLTVHVGLGTGSKGEQLAGAQLLIGAQEKAIPLGLVTPKHAYNSAKLIARLTGHKDPSQFFKEPDPQAAEQPIPMPEPPDIQKAKIAAQTQEAQLERQAAIENTQAQADIASNNAKMQNEAALAQRKFEQESAMQDREFALKEKLAFIDAGIKREQHQMQMEFMAVDHQRKGEEHARNMEALHTKQQNGAQNG